MLKLNIRKLKNPYFLLRILIGLILVKLVLSLLNFSTDSDPEINDDEIQKVIRNENDMLVNSNSYNSVFSVYSSVKSSQKYVYDSKYSSIKKMSKNSRPLQDLYKTQHLILQYTTIFGEERLCNTYRNLGERIFIDECPYKNCEFSCDKSAFKRASAVLFHESDLKTELRNDKNFIKNSINLHKYNPDSVFVLYNDEANPVNPVFDDIKFNWTMSYRYDAEISDCAYGCYYKKGVAKDDTEFEVNLNKEFLSRKAQALWFVSNCFSKSRIDFANELNEHLKLKVYGSCKNVVNFRKMFNFSFDSIFGKIFYGITRGITDLFGLSKCVKYSSCEVNELKTNKFYLSFESKNCSNYITEKFWRILRHNLIPVVFQPNKVFYESMAPPGSFIHAQDFDYDPIKLGVYLNSVSKDFSLYKKYFQWKSEFENVFSGKKVEARRLCELCTLLNTERSSIYYESVSKWFNSDCVIN